MKYGPAVKSEVQEMYRGGTPRGRISELKKIPLSTIKSWTRGMVSKPLSFITCAVCGEKTRTLNIQRIYCSLSCKNRANYQQRLEREREKREREQEKQDKFNRAVETLRQARKAAWNRRINRKEYKAELDILEQHLQQESVPQREQDIIWDLLRYVR